MLEPELVASVSLNDVLRGISMKIYVLQFMILLLFSALQGVINAIK